MKKYNSIIRSISTIALTGLWLTYPTANAQEKKYSSELSFTIGGVASYLDYDLQGAKVIQGAGFNLSLDYTYFLSDYFGIATGAEFQRSNSKIKGSGINGAYQTTDFEQEAFEFRYALHSVEEKQTVNFLNIPLMLVFRSREHGLYARVGAKVGLPLTYKSRAVYNLSTSGYYPQYNAELFDPAFMGFGAFENISVENKDSRLKPSYIAAFELGMMHDFGKGTLYSGLYVDYGLNNIAGKKSAPVEYTLNGNGAGFSYNSLMNSVQAGEIRTVSFGVKLRYSFLNI